MHLKCTQIAKSYVTFAKHHEEKRCVTLLEKENKCTKSDNKLFAF